MNIEHIQEGHKGYFRAMEQGQEIGRMTYTTASESMLIIDHTEVSEQQEGKGVGKKMVLAAVEFARKKPVKILPLCPFAKKVFERMPEIQDVRV